MKHLRIFLFGAITAIALTACNQDELSSTSIFSNEPVLDSTLYTYEFDKWLYNNYVTPYNIAFQYKLSDESTDMDYNLVPVRYDKAAIVAHTVKYLWTDVYSKQVSETFIRSYAPRIINVLGSEAVNAAQGTVTLGVAEGGVKITLYNMNDIDLTDIQTDSTKIAWLNKYIFHVMHHEFSHILHQAKTFPNDYSTISAGNYDSQSWQYHTDAEAYALGFVTPYSMCEAHEDFVEVISSYITDTKETWANRGFTMADDHTHIVSVNEAKKGTDIIYTKINYCKTWLKEKYGFELDSIRAEVQRRQDAMTEEIVMNN